jgi:histidinol-phosphatase (PHP family)
MGGLLTLSDDSHGIAQVGTNYERAIGYLESLGVKELYALNGKGESVDSQVSVRSVTLASVKENFKA